VLATAQQTGNAVGVAAIGVLFYGVGGGPGFAASLAYLFVLALVVAVSYRHWCRGAP